MTGAGPDAVAPGSDPEPEAGAAAPKPDPDPEATTNPAPDADGVTTADARAEAGAAGDAAGEAPPARRPGRVRRALGAPVRLLSRIPHPPLHSRRGLFALTVIALSFGATIAVGGVMAIQWTETADFCGRCHTMDPELKAHAMSPHGEVACAECHVEPGVVGWVKAKINGTKQLVDIVLGRFPTPIPPPAHADLPPASETCQRCHRTSDLVANGGPVKIILKPQYDQDEKNTRKLIALVLRPLGLGQGSDLKGVHWHIVEDVQFWSEGERSQKIPLVDVAYRDGTAREFVSGDQVTVTSDVEPDITRIKATGAEQSMDCLDCHNRVGHAIPTVSDSVDEAMNNGDIAPDLPYVKKQAVERLSQSYASAEDADRAIDGLKGWYGAQYPLISETRSRDIDGAVGSLKRIYRLVATPEMRVSASTYPNNLGHQTSPGCFRCHDGNHFLVVDGALTNETIPSSCGTCHTFPQVADQTASIDLGGGGTLMIGALPESHQDQKWVFNHKLAVSTSDGSGTACAACHQPTYCEGCHANMTIKVPHENILFDHATQLASKGAGTCTFCHQAPFCERCHAPGTLPAPYPKPAASPSPPSNTSVLGPVRGGGVATGPAGDG